MIWNHFSRGYPATNVLETLAIPRFGNVLEETLEMFAFLIFFLISASRGSNISIRVHLCFRRLGKTCKRAGELEESL